MRWDAVHPGTWAEKSVGIEFLAGILQEVIAQLLGSRKVIVNGLAVVMLDSRDDLAEDGLQLTQVARDGLAVRHADISPHVGIRRSDARRVAEAAADELDAGVAVIARAVEQSDERSSRDMRHMADDRSTAVVLGDVERREVRACVLEHAHELRMGLGRRPRVLDNDVRLADKEVLHRGIDTALLAARHRMAGDVVDIIWQDLLQVLPDVTLRAARIRQDATFLEVRQDLFHHRHDLQDRRAQEDDVSFGDHGLDIS